MNERGNDAKWYARKNPKLSDWEKLPSLNGITVSKFKKIISKINFKKTKISNYG